MNCTYFLGQAMGANETRLVNDICGSYNFSDVSALKAFINGTWYGPGSYRESLKTATQMSDG